jgi:hypothetical protein
MYPRPGRLKRRRRERSEGVHVSTGVARGNHRAAVRHKEHAIPSPTRRNDMYIGGGVLALIIIILLLIWLF